MSPLFAQVIIEAPQEHFAWGSLLLWAGGAAMLLGFLPLFVVLRQAQARRAWDHAERMRMIEMGLAVPPRDESAWPRALVCIAIGAGVPLVAFSFTLMAYTGRSNAPDELWVAPPLVSGLCAVAASFLAGYLFRGRSGPETATAEAAIDAIRGEKPVMGPEAFDFAGQRG